MAIFVPTYATTMYVREFTPYVVFTLCSSAFLLITLSMWNMLEVFINNNFTRNAPIQQYRYNYAIVGCILCLSANIYVRMIDILFPQVPMYYLIFLWVISTTPYVITIVLGFLLYDYIFPHKKKYNEQALRDEDN